MSLKRSVSSSLEGTVHGAQAASKAVAPPNKRRGFDSSTFLHRGFAQAGATGTIWRPERVQILHPQPTSSFSGEKMTYAVNSALREFSTVLNNLQKEQFRLWQEGRKDEANLIEEAIQDMNKVYGKLKNNFPSEG